MAIASEAVASGVAVRRRASVWLWVVLVLSVAIGLYGLSYLSGHGAPPGPAQNHAGPGWLVVHASCAGIALLLGPWQFFASIRARRPVVHRWIGRSYVTLCLVGGLTGAVLAWNTSAGELARWGFLLLALTWLTVTGLAYLAVRRRDFVSHRRWMIRSFALTFAAVTLRLYIPLSAIAGLSMAFAYPLTAWAAWVPNLIVAEIWLRTHRA
jgi:Predicted membrane protein (DUF2306)